MNSSHTNMLKKNSGFISQSSKNSFPLKSASNTTINKALNSNQEFIRGVENGAKSRANLSEEMDVPNRFTTSKRGNSSNYTKDYNSNRYPYNASNYLHDAKEKRHETTKRTDHGSIEFNTSDHIYADDHSSNDGELILWDCPLCMEEVDEKDIDFTPCECGYQICRFCWHHIKTVLNNKCPACRRPYSDQESSLDASVSFNSGLRRKERKNKVKVFSLEDKKDSNRNEEGSLAAVGKGALLGPVLTSRKHLTELRVLQPNLAYVIGIPLSLDCYPSINSVSSINTLSTVSILESLLATKEYFGVYGELVKLVINLKGQHSSRSFSQKGKVSSTVSAFLTFARREDALKAIEGIDGTYIHGFPLRATYGTTKYCAFFLRGLNCPNLSHCLYLHELGDEVDSYTKEALSARQRDSHLKKGLSGVRLHDSSQKSENTDQKEVYPKSPITTDNSNLNIESKPISLAKEDPTNDDKCSNSTCPIISPIFSTTVFDSSFSNPNSQVHKKQNSMGAMSSGMLVGLSISPPNPSFLASHQLNLSNNPIVFDPMDPSNDIGFMKKKEAMLNTNIDEMRAKDQHLSIREKSRFNFVNKEDSIIKIPIKEQDTNSELNKGLDYFKSLFPNIRVSLDTASLSPPNCQVPASLNEPRKEEHTNIPPSAQAFLEMFIRSSEKEGSLKKTETTPEPLTPPLTTTSVKTLKPTAVPFIPSNNLHLNPCNIKNPQSNTLHKTSSESLNPMRSKPSVLSQSKTTDSAKGIENKEQNTAFVEPYRQETGKRNVPGYSLRAPEPLTISSALNESNARAVTTTPVLDGNRKLINGHHEVLVTSKKSKSKPTLVSVLNEENNMKNKVALKTNIHASSSNPFSLLMNEEPQPLEEETLKNFEEREGKNKRSKDVKKKTNKKEPKKTHIKKDASPNFKLDELQGSADRLNDKVDDNELLPRGLQQGLKSENMIFEGNSLEEIAQSALETFIKLYQEEGNLCLIDKIEGKAIFIPKEYEGDFLKNYQKSAFGFEEEEFIDWDPSLMSSGLAGDDEQLYLQESPEPFEVDDKIGLYYDSKERLHFRCFEDENSSGGGGSNERELEVSLSDLDLEELVEVFPDDASEEDIKIAADINSEDDEGLWISVEDLSALEAELEAARVENKILEARLFSLMERNRTLIYFD